MRKILKSRRGEAAIEAIAILFILLVSVVAFMNISSVVTAKQQLDTYASELCRTAEISGRVGSETTERAGELTEDTGLSPEISWSDTGKIQINKKITVTCSVTKNIGVGGIGSWPITIRSTASGKSEVYWKS